MLLGSIWDLLLFAWNYTSSITHHFSAPLPSDNIHGADALQLQYAAFKSKAIMRDCPHCLEEISMAATRCKFCCGEIVIDEEMQQVISMATAAMEAEQQKYSKRWLSKCFRWCIRQPKAVVKQQGGSVELEAVADAA